MRVVDSVRGSGQPRQNHIVATHSFTKPHAVQSPNSWSLVVAGTSRRQFLFEQTTTFPFFFFDVLLCVASVSVPLWPLLIPSRIFAGVTFLWILFCFVCVSVLSEEDEN